MMMNIRFLFPGVAKSVVNDVLRAASFSTLSACLICAISNRISGSRSSLVSEWKRASTLAALLSRPCATRNRGDSGTILRALHKHQHPQINCPGFLPN